MPQVMKTDGTDGKKASVLEQSFEIPYHFRGWIGVPFHLPFSDFSPFGLFLTFRMDQFLGDRIVFYKRSGYFPYSCAASVITIIFSGDVSDWT